MLRVGVNSVGTDYNRETVYVHHLTDEIAGKTIPICGADIFSLIDGGDADSMIDLITRGQKPFSDDGSSRMCVRCARAYLAPGTEEEKSEKRLVRWRRKEARSKLLESNKLLVLSQWLNRCPKCLETIVVKEPPGYYSAGAYCDRCRLEWSFLISVEPSGSFVIWADDDVEVHSGRAEGHINLKEIVWNWR